MKNHTEFFIKRLGAVRDSISDLLDEIENDNDEKKSLSKISQKYGYKTQDGLLSQYHLELKIQSNLASLIIDDDNIQHYKTLQKIKKQLLIEFFYKQEKTAKINFLVIDRILENLNTNKCIASFDDCDTWNTILEQLILLFTLYVDQEHHSLSKCFIKDCEEYHLAKHLLFFHKETKFEKIRFIDGEVVFPKSTERQILTLLENRIRNLNILSFIDYIVDLGKRKSHQDKPLMFLFNLAIKNLSTQNRKTKEDVEDFDKIIDFAYHFIGLYDCYPYNEIPYLVLHERYDLLFELLPKMALYVKYYPLRNSVNIGEICLFIKYSLFGSSTEQSLNEIGITYQDLDKLFRMIVLKMDTEKSFSAFFTQDEIRLFGLNANLLNKLSISGKDVNKYCSFPNDKNEKIDKTIRYSPIVRHNGGYLFPAFTITKNFFFDSILDRSRKQIKKLDDRIGIQLEDLLLKALNSNGREIHRGCYKEKEKDKHYGLEADLVIKADGHIFLFECKKRMPSPSAMCGNHFELFDYFVSTIFKASIQLEKQEALLRQEGKIIFEDSTLTYKQEKIYKFIVLPYNLFGFMTKIPLAFLDSLLRYRAEYNGNDTNFYSRVKGTNDCAEKLMKQREKMQNFADRMILIPLELLISKSADKIFLATLARMAQMTFQGVKDPFELYRGLNWN